MPLPVSLNLLSIILFLAALAVLVWRDRENIERYSIVFVRRTKHGIAWLDRVASLSPRFWRLWATLGVVVGFVGMVGIFLIILHQTLKLFLLGSATPPVGPVLPTVSTTTNPEQAGYLGLPFWHFMISLTVVMVAHELMHGVIARVEGFDIEYVGIILLGIIPGAFVQPEGQRDFFEPEEGAEQGSPWGDGTPLSKLRVLGAGPMGNVTVAALLFPILFLAFTTAHGPLPELQGFHEHSGVPIVGVQNDSAAQQAGLRAGMTITAVGGNDTLDLAQFRAAMGRTHPGETVSVATRGNGTFQVTLDHPPERGNLTFEPAPVDYLLPALEKEFPGAIEQYEAYNDVLVPEDKQLRIARWRWIADRYPALEERAGQRTAALQDQLPDEDPKGYLGIFVPRSNPVKEELHRVYPYVFGFFHILFFIALLNLMIGIANLLPIKGLDGGWMLDTILQERVPERADWLVRQATLVTIAMVAISFAFLIAEHLL